MVPFVIFVIYLLVLPRRHFFPDGDGFLNVDRLGQIATLAGVVGGGKSRA